MSHQRNSQQKKEIKTPLLKNRFFQFIVISLLAMTLLLVLAFRSDVSIFLTKWTTIILDNMLNWLHFKTRMTGNQILLLDGSQIKFQIIDDCTGIYPFIILTSLMIGFPSALIKKIIGILAAVFFTFLFNYLRLILLFVIGRHSAKWFEIAHLFIWQISFVLFIVFFFVWWVQWVIKVQKKK